MAKKNRNAKSKRAGKPRFPLLTERRTYSRAQLEEIARAQGKELRPWTEEDRQEMIKLGKALFRSHKEREEFFAGIDERRRQSRGS